MIVHIPTWEEAESRCNSDDHNPIDTFVFENEPLGIIGRESEKKFRKELQEMLEFVAKMYGWVKE